MESGSQPPPTSPPPPTPPPPPPPPPPPYTPQVPTESRVQLGKTIWRLFMVANLGLGAYLFVTANKQKEPKKGKATQTVIVEEAPHPPPPQPESPLQVDFGYEPDIVPSATTEPPLPRKPIPEDQQKDLFQWMLEEKRKIQPKDREEKKRIDEEKAILKQFIRAQSIPRI